MIHTQLLNEMIAQLRSGAPRPRAELRQARLVQLEKAMRERPAWLPVAITLTASTTEKVTYTEPLDYPVIIVAALSTFATALQFRIVPTDESRPWMGELVDAGSFAGNAATAPVSGPVILPAPYLLEANRRLEVRYKNTTGAGAEAGYLTFICVRLIRGEEAMAAGLGTQGMSNVPASAGGPLRGGVRPPGGMAGLGADVPGGELRTIAESILRSSPEQPCSVFIMMAVAWATEGKVAAGDTLRDRTTNEQTVPLIVLGASTRLLNCVARVYDQSGFLWSPSDIPVSAFASSYLLNTRTPYFYFPRPFYLPANSAIHADFINGINGVPEVADRDINFMCVTP